MRSTSERMVPLKHKMLAEILNPMAEATEVIARLLDFIDRVDVASQAGAPRPPFETVDGGSIFPEDPENHWWLTGISKQKLPEEDQQNEGHEDGPPSEYDEGGALHVSDEDPLSEDDGPRPSVPSEFVPNLAWASS